MPILCGSQDPRRKDARQMAIQRVSKPPLKPKAGFAVFSLMTAVEATVSFSGLSYLFLLFQAFPLSKPAVDLMSFEVPVT
jgi:hypothetical protein